MSPVTVEATRVVVPCSAVGADALEDVLGGAGGEGGSAAAVVVDVDEAGDQPVAGQVDDVAVRGALRPGRRRLVTAGGDPASATAPAAVDHVRWSCATRAPVGSVAPCRRVTGGWPSGGYLRRSVVIRRSQASSPAPRHPAVSPRAAGTMAGSFWKVTRCLDGGPQRCEQGFPRLGEAATDDQGARVQQGEGGDQAVGERVDGVLPDRRRPRVARRRRPWRSPPRPPPGRRRPPPRPRLTAAAEAYRLQAAALAAAARRPAGAYDDVADLAREAVRARLDPAVDADGARDAGAQRHEQEAVGALARADPALGEAAGAYVVAEGDRDAAEPLGEQLAQRYVAPAEVGGVDGDARARRRRCRGRRRRPRRRSRRAAAAPCARRSAAKSRIASTTASGPRSRPVARRAWCSSVPSGADQGGLHPGAAHIEGDDVSHGDSVARRPGRGLVHYVV